MSGVSVIFRNGMRISLRSRATVAIGLALAVFFIAAINVLGCFVFLPLVLGPGGGDPDRIANVLGLILYGTGLIAFGLTLNVFTSMPLVKEKARRTYESLLSTPLSVPGLWIGKSLAVFVPGLVLTVLSTLLSFGLISGLVIAPRVGLVMTPLMFVNGFLVVPCLYFLLTLLVHLVSLTGDPVAGNVIAQIFLPVLASGFMNLAGREVLPASGWVFTLVHGILLVLVGISILILSGRLTKERIVLSGRK
jgi:hypothetical protein